jgi:excisionase family DNA binding protein
MSREIEALLTTAEVAELLAKSPYYIYANAVRLGIPRIRVGRHYRYRRTDVEAWLDAQRVAA